MAKNPMPKKSPDVKPNATYQKFTPKTDDTYDAQNDIPEDSGKDKKLDKKRGVK